MASKAQIKRDKQAIRTVLTQQGRSTMSTILLHAGEDLADAMLEMVEAGEVERTQVADRYHYSLAAQ